MRKQTKRFLSFVMAFFVTVTTVFGNVSGPVFAEDTEKGVWQEVAFDDIQPTDNVAITMTKDDKTYVLPTSINGSGATPAGVLADGKYVIYNSANKMALSSNYSGNYNAGVEMTLNSSGSFDSVTEDLVWTVKNNADGTVTISHGTDKLSMDVKYTSMPFNKDNDTWTIEKNVDNTYKITNVGRTAFVQWRADKSYWSAYYEIDDASAALFAQSFIPVTDKMIKKDDSPSSDTGLPKDGSYYLYSAKAPGVMSYGWTGGSASYKEVKVDEATNTVADKKSLEGAAVLKFEYDSSKTAYTIKCGNQYLAVNTAEEICTSTEKTDTSTLSTYWVLEKNDSFKGFTIKNKTVKYNNKEVYMEYYSSKGFCMYTMKEASDIFFFDAVKAEDDSDTDGDGYAYGILPVAGPKPAAGSKIVISNDSNSQVIGSMIKGTDGSESKMSGIDIEFDKKEDGSIDTGKYSVSNGAAIYTVGLDDKMDFSGAAKFVVGEKDGHYTFAVDGKYLSSVATGDQLTFETTANEYSLWDLQKTANGYYIINTNAEYTYNTSKYKSAIEYFGGYFAGYEFQDGKAKYSGPAFDMSFYSMDGKKLDTIKAGDEVAIYNQTNKAAMLTKLTSKNKAYGLTVSDEGYYYFENNGKYLATNNDEELLVQDQLNDFSKWELVETLGGYLIKNKTAAWKSSSGNSYPIYIEYFSGAFAGYSFKATSADIFTFNFYEVEDKYNTGYVINPRVKFTTEAEANWEVDYTMNFTLDDLGEILATKASVTFDDKSTKTYDITLDDKDGKIIIPGQDLVGHKSMEVKVDATSQQTKEVKLDYTGSKTVAINDNPMITKVSPAANAETGSNKRPEVAFTYANIGDGASASLTVNGDKVTIKRNDSAKTYTYTPAKDLEDGKYTAVATVTRKDGKTATKSWSFTVGKSGAKLYFGQIHSHTAQYSDGSGTLAQAYEYSMKAKNIDYMIVTDHSNYFDTTGNNSMDSIYNAADSHIKASSTPGLNLWQEAKKTAADYDAKSDKFMAAYGYEMTWSGGPGHINVFNTAGIVSRNNTTLNNKTNNSGMLTFYDLLVKANDQKATSTGNGSISAQFNHPGTTFGYFDSFTGWTPERDNVLNLIEVGNGDGKVGGTAYFPSYEYYDMCLTNGWHVAPTNGQDNHKGLWGDSNSCRTVALSEANTEDGVYDAMSKRHIYSTEDQNLSVVFSLDDTLQGGVIDNYNKDKVAISVSLSDEDNEALGYVYVIGLNGKVLYKSDMISENTADLDIELDNTSPYYYVKVVQKDKDIAVTAPVWVANVKSEANVKASVKTASDGTDLKPVVGEVEKITASLANSEESDIQLTGYSINVDNETVETQTLTSPVTVKAGSSYSVDYDWTPKKNGKNQIKVSFVYTINGEAKTATASKNLYVAGKDYNTVTDIKTVKAGKEGQEFTIEGTVTANTSGYDQNTAFFDCTYVQDATGGINVFPVSDSLQAGQKVRMHGAITYYNGEMELNLSEDYGGYVKVIDPTINEVEPTEVTCKEAMADDNIGLLMKVTGTVTRINEASDVIDRIYVKDDKGSEACIYINGYIWNSMTQKYNFGKDGSIIKVGDKITAVGIGSVDVDELGEVDYLHRLRVRDRAEINLVASGDSSKEHEHTWDKGVITKKATEKANGVITYTCTECKEQKTESIAKIKSYRLSKNVYVYNKKSCKPSVTVKDANNKTIDKKYYTVSYSKNVKVGKATVTIKFKDRYQGTKQLSFVIAPKGTKITKLAGKKKALVLKWSKQTAEVSGYQIQISTSSKFAKKSTKTIVVKSNKLISKMITRLKANKKYYVRIRTYKNVGKTKYYSSWSKVKTVKTK